MLGCSINTMGHDHGEEMARERRVADAEQSRTACPANLLGTTRSRGRGCLDSPPETPAPLSASRILY